MRKGQLGDLTALAWGIMLFGIILILGAIIVSSFQNTAAVYNNTVANGTANQVLAGFSLMSSYIGLIVTVGIMAFLVGLVLIVFGGSLGGGGGKRYE
jgi:hypothetical protein